jgi:hypothetical protein
MRVAMLAVALVGAAGTTASAPTASGRCPAAWELACTPRCDWGIAGGIPAIAGAPVLEENVAADQN